MPAAHGTFVFRQAVLWSFLLPHSLKQQSMTEFIFFVHLELPKSFFQKGVLIRHQITERPIVTETCFRITNISFYSIIWPRALGYCEELIILYYIISYFQLLARYLFIPHIFFFLVLIYWMAHNTKLAESLTKLIILLTIYSDFLIRKHLYAEDDKF